MPTFQFDPSTGESYQVFNSGQPLEDNQRWAVLKQHVVRSLKTRPSEVLIGTVNKAQLNTPGMNIGWDVAVQQTFKAAAENPVAYVLKAYVGILDKACQSEDLSERWMAYRLVNSVIARTPNADPRVHEVLEKRAAQLYQLTKEVTAEDLHKAAEKCRELGVG